jgi:hypothetical protein
LIVPRKTKRGSTDSTICTPSSMVKRHASGHLNCRNNAVRIAFLHPIRIPLENAAQHRSPPSARQHRPGPTERALLIALASGHEHAPCSAQRRHAAVVAQSNRTSQNPTPMRAERPCATSVHGRVGVEPGMAFPRGRDSRARAAIPQCQRPIEVQDARTETWTVTRRMWQRSRPADHPSIRHYEWIAVFDRG